MTYTSDTKGRMVSMASERRPQVRMRTLPQELPRSSQRPFNFAMNQRLEASCFRFMISEVGLKVSLLLKSQTQLRACDREA